MDEPRAQQRFIAALSKLSDVKLLSVARPLGDLQEVVAGALPAVVFYSDHPGVERDLPTVVGDPQAIEFYEALSAWMMAELDSRHDLEVT